MYTIYLDKDETFSCEASIKNASYKNSSARLILESEDVNLVFFGEVGKDTINIPIKSLKKYFTEKDTAKLKLEVIVENNLVTPWESEVEFDNFNKVEIREVKQVKQKPLIEVKVKEKIKEPKTSPKKIEPKPDVISEDKQFESDKENLLLYLNEEINKININTKLTKLEKKNLIKNLIKRGL